MKKITVATVVLIALCFVSGGYAFYNNILDDVTDISPSNSAIADSSNPKTDSISNDENPITTDISNKIESISKVLEHPASYSAISPTHRISTLLDFDANGYSVSNSDYYSFYVPEGYDTTDKFAQCAECGKYFSYGAVTKALPEHAVCHGHDDCLGSVFDSNNPNVLSYDEVMYYLEHHKAPESVYNRVHDYYGNFGGFDSYSDYLAGITQEHNEPVHTMPVTETIAIPHQDSVTDNDVENNADASPNVAVQYY